MRRIDSQLWQDALIRIPIRLNRTQVCASDTVLNLQPTAVGRGFQRDYQQATMYCVTVAVSITAAKVQTRHSIGRVGSNVRKVGCFSIP